MTTITTSIASLRTAARLDTRHVGRYHALDTLHAHLRRRQKLAAQRQSLAAEVTHRRYAKLISSNPM